MPFSSKAQQRWMFANHPKMAKEWASHTDFSKLPERKKKKKLQLGGTMKKKNLEKAQLGTQVGEAASQIGRGFPDKPEHEKKPKKVVVFAESPFIRTQDAIWDDGPKIPESIKKLKKEYLDYEQKLYNEYGAQNVIFDKHYKTKSKAIDSLLTSYFPGKSEKDKTIIFSDLISDDTHSLTSEYAELYRTNPDIPRLRARVRHLYSSKPVLDTTKVEAYKEKLGSIGKDIDKEIEKHNLRNPTFVTEANNLKTFYKRKYPDVEVDINPVYKQDYDTIKSKLKNVGPQDNVFLFGHYGDKYAGIENQEWAEMLKNTNYQNCYLGSCGRDPGESMDVLSPFESLKNFTYRKQGSWWGVNPNANSLIDAMYSRKKGKLTGDPVIGTPEKGTDYATFQKGGMKKRKFQLAGQYNRDTPILIDPITGQPIQQFSDQQNYDWMRTNQQTPGNPNLPVDPAMTAQVDDTGDPVDLRIDPIKQKRNGNWVIKPNKPKIDPFFAIRGAVTGLSWLSGMAERRRQNQYMYNQLSTLGQRGSVPYEDYQPNPFSLYARYGGTMKSGGWIAKAAASIKRRGTKGKCTPITKPGCTGRAKALAKTFKKIARNRKKK